MPDAVLFIAEGFVDQMKTAIEYNNLAQLRFKLFAVDKVIHWFDARVLNMNVKIVAS